MHCFEMLVFGSCIALQMCAEAAALPCRTWASVIVQPTSERFKQLVAMSMLQWSGSCLGCRDVLVAIWGIVASARYLSNQAMYHCRISSNLDIVFYCKILVSGNTCLASCAVYTYMHTYKYTYARTHMHVHIYITTLLYIYITTLTMMGLASSISII